MKLKQPPTNGDACKRLATRLASSGAVTVASLLANGTAAPLPSSGRNPVSALGDDTRGLLGTQSVSSVGIWEIDHIRGGFRRSHAHTDLWRFCADVDWIPPKGQRPRIAFLGESVARGFFYDPFYSPATVLKALFEAYGKPVEVVDLAQSNIDARSLTVLAASTRLLKPDVLVVFAGNNWQSPGLSLVSADSFVSDGESLRTQGGFAAIADRLRRQVVAQAEAIIRAIAASASAMNADVVFVIPEINLTGWSNCPQGTLDLPSMEGQDVEEWLNAFTKARHAIDIADLDTARTYLERAIEIDAGVCSTSLHALGEVLLRTGNHHAAVSAFRRSRDISVRKIDGTLSIPGILNEVAGAIRHLGHELGARLVDLPLLFERDAASEFYSGSLHFDYCHLTSRGIQLAMAATAEAVGSLLEISMPSLATMTASAPSPSVEQEGWAHLLAAVHNAHWGQSAETCARYVTRAVHLHPALLDSAIPLLYDAFRHRTPALFVDSFQNLVKSKASEVYLVGYGLHYYGLGRVSEGTLIAALDAVDGPHRQMAADPDYSLGSVTELDLLDPHFSNLTDGNRYFPRGFVACYSPRPEWHFASDASHPVEITITCRVPGALEVGRICVFVNDTAVGDIQVGAEWESLRLVVPEPRITSGLNRLTLVWPSVPRCDPRSVLLYDFEHGHPVDARFHFGHVHQMQVALYDR